MPADPQPLDVELTGVDWHEFTVQVLTAAKPAIVPALAVLVLVMAIGLGLALWSRVTGSQWDDIEHTAYERASIEAWNEEQE